MIILHLGGGFEALKSAFAVDERIITQGDLGLIGLIL